METESSLAHTSTTDLSTQIHLTSGGEAAVINSDQLAHLNGSQLQVQLIHAPSVLDDQRTTNSEVPGSALVELTPSDQHVDASGNIVSVSGLTSISNITWRTAPVATHATYYDTPLTSATNTMLNIHSIDENAVAVPIVYEPAYRHEDG